MHNLLLHKKRSKVIYLLGFMFAFSIAISSYIDSTFLSSLVSEKNTGLVYTAASLFTILGIIAIQPILRRFGNYRVTLSLLAFNILSLIILASTETLVFVLPAFICYFSIASILYFNMDIFLEESSTNKDTGSIRGVYLTLFSIAWVISPMITGLILTDGDYWRIYMTAAFLYLPIIFIVLFYLKDFKDPIYKKVSFFDSFREIKKDKNIYKIFLCNLMLNFFYTWMVIYTPIYLHQHMGFDWRSIGIIFTIMLLPFALFEYPLGWLADKKLGEKEILSLGFVVISLSSAIISFITSSSIWIWAIVLFMTRVGASMIEIMSETYFFKKTGGEDTELIGFFRMSKPLAYVISPILATLVLLYADLKYIFIILGIIMIYGLRYSLTIKDTK